MFQKTFLAAALVALPVAFAGEAKAQCGAVCSNPGYSGNVYQAGYYGYSSYRRYRAYRSPYYSGYRSSYSPYNYRSPYRYYSPYGYYSRRYPSRYSAGYRVYGPTVVFGRRGYYGWPGYYNYGWWGY